jgi:hypothetical protein
MYQRQDRFTQMERFLSRVKWVGECLEWQAGLHKSGYGHIRYGRRMVMAHRFSYIIHKGPIEPGLFILHSCDNKKCVNPAHLRQGTAKENTADAIERGQFKVSHTIHPPEINKNRRLNRPDVIVIRRRLKAGETVQSVADSYGVGHMTISDIKRGVTWKAVK